MFNLKRELKVQDEGRVSEYETRRLTYPASTEIRVLGEIIGNDVAFLVPFVSQW